MTDDPRVEAVAREMYRLEYGGATDWDADGSLHSAFYLAAESILAAADAARPLTADVAGLVERLLRGGASSLERGAAYALIALAARAETAERERDEALDERDSLISYRDAVERQRDDALRKLAEATEALEQCLGSLKAFGAEKGWASETARAALAQITGEARDE